MRKLFFLLITSMFLSVSFSAKAQEADNPAERDRQAAELIKDPALGYVPYNRLLNAINHTEA